MIGCERHGEYEDGCGDCWARLRDAWGKANEKFDRLLPMGQDVAIDREARRIVLPKPGRYSLFSDPPTYEPFPDSEV